MVPPLCLTTPNTVARPSPVPAPGALVVKNGSKRGRRTSPLMPTPVSLTASSTFGPGVPSPRGRGARGAVGGERGRAPPARHDDPAGGDLDVDDRAVLGLVPPHARHRRAGAAGALEIGHQAVEVLGGPD